MKKGKSVFSWVSILASLAIVLGFGLEAMGVTETATTGKARPDIIEIRTLGAFGKLEAAPVTFLHDKHTDALKNDCKSCHPTDKQTNPATGEKRMSVAFMRPDGKLEMGKDELKKLYHANCFACHAKMAQAGEKTGPQDGECRSCHQEKPAVVSNRVPFGLDKSLHYRHIANKDIRPVTSGSDTNCDRCHQVFDEKLNKFVYNKGQEESCRACHPAEATEKQSSMQRVSHVECVGCHQEMRAKKLEAGPVQCAGCHGVLEQKRIKVLPEVPRLKRNQPDLTLVTATLDKPEDGSKRTFMAPVAFNHKAHEAYNDTCRVCHHKNMDACSKCHTVTGSKDGDFVTLEQAMHQLNAKASCVGCHAQRTEKKECAGCHNTLPAKAKDDKFCATCHQKVDAPGVAEMQAASVKGEKMDKEQKAAAAAMLIDARPKAPVVYAKDDMPETVEIGVLSDEYKPSKFPHRKVVEALLKGIGDNQLAAVFHGDKLTLCQGCHHNSPASAQPPRCASCHAKPFNPAEPMRPGLKGAYHGQCIGCHQAMGLEKPKATDCTACHEKRN